MEGATEPPRPEALKLPPPAQQPLHPHVISLTTETDGDTSPEAYSETDDEEAESQIRWSTMLPIIVFVLIYAVIFCIFIIYRKELMPLVTRFSEWVRGFGL